MNKFSFSCTLLMLLVSPSPGIAQHKDCNTALELCDQFPFYIFPGGGNGMPDAGIANTCVIQEFNSMWVKWTVLESGIITFVLTPDTIEQDIDFIIFQSAGDYDCTNKTQIRCMAAGANTGEPPHQWVNCTGITGLSVDETDVEEPPGCPSGSNNFLAPIQAVAGDQYIMLINEFSGVGYGYTLSFTGTAVLDCMTSSADPEEVKSSFDVYPTVSTGTIYISIAGAGPTDTRLHIFSIEGQMVHATDPLTRTIFQVDLHHLPQGTYYAILTTSHSAQTQKFILTK